MGAICKYCKGDMLKVDGCIKVDIIRKGKMYEPIKMGDPEDSYFLDDEDTRCGDCGAKMGQYHHVGCDCEICPVCGGQLIGCDCAYDE